MLMMQKTIQEGPQALGRWTGNDCKQSNHDPNETRFMFNSTDLNFTFGGCV